MKGKILDFSVSENKGAISGYDGNRYTFSGSDWKDSKTPQKGMEVDFDVDGKEAKDVYVIAIQQNTSQNRRNSKDKTAAGLLAIFLGTWGIHKFYLGYKGPGLVYLLVNTIGWAITWMMAGIPNLIFAIIAFIEGIIYLTKSDEEFQKTYVDNEKPWF